jgi:hypothetical protein
VAGEFRQGRGSNAGRKESAAGDGLVRMHDSYNERHEGQIGPRNLPGSGALPLRR